MFPGNQEILTPSRLTRMPRRDNILRVKPFKAIAAMSLNRVIGSGNKIPWHLPEDFKWFKQKTIGNVIVMGRRTFESIGKPLPNRTTIVLSRGGHIIQDVLTLRNFDELQSRLSDFPGKEFFICGGAQIYEQGLDRCSDLFLTLVKREVEGDTWFPEFESRFRLESELMETPDFKVLHYVTA
jgi:dihydrofolate reductase